MSSTTTLPDWLKSLPDPTATEALHQIHCSECGSECDYIDDGWTQCNECVIVFDTRGSYDDIATSEFREYFASLPGTNPHERQVSDYTVSPVTHSTVQTERCVHCNAPPDWKWAKYPGHYRGCIWALAVTKAAA